MLEERKTGEKVEVCEVQGVALIVFVNLPAVMSSFILAICGCTKEQEGLGGVELANGAFPQKHSSARTSSVATNIGGMNVNDCGGEPVRGLSVCSVVLCSLRQSHSENPLLALGQSCKHNIGHRSVNSGQSHNPYLPSTIIVGEFVPVTNRKESNSLSRMWRPDCQMQ